jgi:hypothetical protein
MHLGLCSNREANCADILSTELLDMIPWKEEILTDNCITDSYRLFHKILF